MIFIAIEVCMYVCIYREIVCKEQTEEKRALIVYVVSKQDYDFNAALMQNHKHL
jgi:hypothetical protein